MESLETEGIAPSVPEGMVEISRGAARTSRLARLKEKLQGLTAHIPQQNPIVYLDYPLHTNIGDLLIRRGTEQFFADFKYDVALRWPAVPLALRHLKVIGPQTTIVFHGGGNFGDIYHGFELFRESIVERFPNNKIVVLPQTVYFQDDSNLRRAAQVFNSHRDVVVFVRDERSRRKLADEFKCPIIVMPDMAHQLWQVIDSAERGEGTLYFFRRDVETASNELCQDQDSLDWKDVLSLPQYLMWRMTSSLHVWESRSDARLFGPEIWALQTNWIISRAIRTISRYETIVTDRLHACILGCLLGKKVFFVDNSYGKLTGYYDTWLRKDAGNAQ